MSYPDPGPEEPGAERRPPHPYPFEQGTDPGRAQPYESLYRGSLPTSAGSHRATARHFEPWLNAPEEEPASGDTFHWLYRPDCSTDATEETPDPVPPGRSASVAGDVLGDPVNALPGPPGEKRRGSRRRVWFVVALVLLLGSVGAAVLVQRNQADSPGSSRVPSMGAHPGSASIVPVSSDPNPSGSAGSSDEPAVPTQLSGGPYTGSVLPLTATGVVSPCEAPAATDDAGQPVHYGASLVTDDDPRTAWRCKGSGVGRRMVFTFAANSRIAALGLVNGYAKVDPASHAHRYGEYRRILEVRWAFAGGPTIRQLFKDRDEIAQTLRIPVQRTDRVTLTITRTTTPGRSAGSRDAVLISEATFASPGT